MDDLVTFLKARLNEDEKAALTTLEGHPLAEWTAVGTPGESDLERSNWAVVNVAGPDDKGPWTRAIMQHIARHDPARVLREVQAKRQIIRDYENAALALSHAGTSGTVYDLMTGAVNTLKRAILRLAEVYDQDPYYLEEWRP